MKKTTLFIFLILASFSVFSQTYYGKEAQAIIPGTGMIVKDQLLDIPTFIKFAEGSEIRFSEWELWFKNHFKISPDFGLQLLRTENDKLGFTHYRYQQTYKGFPIYSNIFIIHVKNNLVVSMNGQLFSKTIMPDNITLTEAQALDKAIEYVGAESYKWQIPGEERLLKYTINDENATYFPKGELMLVPSDHNFISGDYHLTYKFDIYAHQPMSRQWIYVDVSTGQIIMTLERIHSENQDVNSNATGSAATKYSDTRTITTDYTGSTYRLRETTRGLGIETYNLQKGTTYTNTDFTDADNNWTGTNSNKDEVARDAHWGTEMTYDYFYNKFGRNSINNAGLKLISYVHYDVNYVNAFWDGTRMTYGDGDATYSPLTTLDICGHEITHGLTEYTANLDYSYESGALSEGFSDIFGTSIEFYAKPPSQSGNWTIGEEIGEAFRSMSNPNLYDQPDTYQGTDWYTGSGDNGGVHYNSGVLNFWFYLLCQGGSGTNDNGNAYNVTAITMAKAEQIAFRALTVYLTSTSQYADARTYTLQACTELYGGCSQEMISTTNAWYAVGVGAAYSSAAVDADFSACPSSQCSAAPFTAAFTNLSTNANTYKWYFGDGSTSTLSAPSHTYTSNGAYDVKLVAYGGTCGSDSITKSGYITVGPSYPCPVSMPSSGTGTTQTSCNGSLFDSGLCGDYANNTAGTITIAPTSAASVTLTFNSFSFESGYDYLYVYDGPSTASLQVTGSPFSGTTLPGPITSSGGSITLRQTTDAGVVASGFSLDWTCTGTEVPPVVNFVAGTTTSCTGTINFTDQSSNSPTSWLWNFGDGQTATVQNPTHTYTANGLYTVKLKATNPYGTDSLIRTNYITIDMPEGPMATGATICPGTTAQLTASGSGTFNWFDTPNGTTSIYTGSSFTTPMLNSTTNYYVQTTTGGTAYTGLTNIIQANTSNVSAEQGLIFTALQPFVLKSVKVRSIASAAASKTVTLKNSAGTTLSTVTVNNVPTGESRITLNINVPVGTDLRLTAPASSYLMRDNTVPAGTYPITLPDVLSITSNTAGSEIYYYYFYDWEIESPSCTSSRTEVTALVNLLPDAAGTISGTDPVCQNQQDATYTIPPISNADEYVWTLPSGATITAGNNTNSITVSYGPAAASGNISVYGTSACGNGTPAANFPVTVGPTVAAAGSISGTANVCQNQSGVTYTVPSISNATGYVWSLPSGANITAGNNTNTITVNFGPAATSGNISVYGTNTCGSGTASANYPINLVQSVAAAGTISGTSTVCQNETGIVYTVPQIANATGYVWSLPSGATITSGDNTNSITVSFGPTASSGNITVYGTNTCGNGDVSANYLVSVNQSVAASGTISGEAFVCQNQTSVTYSVAQINNATGYVWSLPNGTFITAGNNTNSITVTYGPASVSGNITVYGTGICDNGVASANYQVTVNPVVAAAGVITGASIVCQNQTGVSYTVPPITNTTGYVWSLPLGSTIISGDNTNSITVNYGPSAASGNISVYGTNNCGNGGASADYVVTVNPPIGSAGIITGSQNVCLNQADVTFTIPQIANATGYVWSLPSGASITSGANTNSITVNFGSSASSGNISVYGTGDCGNGGVSENFAVTVIQNVAAAGAIFGTPIVCQGESDIIYTVPVIDNASGYVWSLPTGASITSGDNSNSITVSYSLSATSGTVSVYGTNTCGNGTTTEFPVTVINKPSTPIITLNGVVLLSDATFGNQWYDQNGLINGAANQYYVVSANGDYYVISTIDGCSSDPSNIISFVFTGIESASSNNIKVYPNPVSDELVIENESNSENVYVEIYNSIGEKIFNGSFIHSIIIPTSGLSKGVYFIKIKNEKTFEYRKVVKE